MVWLKLAKFVAIGLGGLLVLTLVLSIVASVIGAILGVGFAIVGIGWALFGMVMALLVPAVSLAILGAIIYGVYTLVSDNTNDASDRSGGRNRERAAAEGSSEPEDPIDRIKTRYARGEITERELELAIERELDRESSAAFELERERT